MWYENLGEMVEVEESRDWVFDGIAKNDRDTGCAEERHAAEFHVSIGE